MELVLIVCAWVAAGYVGARIWLWDERCEFGEIDDGDRAFAAAFAITGPIWLAVTLMFTARRWSPRSALVNLMPIIRRIFP